MFTVHVTVMAFKHCAKKKNNNNFKTVRKFKRGTSTFVADSGFRGLTDPRKLPCKFTVTTLHISLKTKIVESKANMTSLAGKKQAGNQKFLSTLIIQNALPRCFYFFPSNPSNSTF